MDTIDLRSDTVTHPTPEMRRAMAEAQVGDDVFGEDPTVNRLQAMGAERMGKEAGLFVASGTMGNLVAVLSHCGRGEEVILGDRAHTFLYEAGGVAALGGVHPHPVPNQTDGTLRLEDVGEAIRAEDVHFPHSRLVCLENTQNRCGGAVLTAEYTDNVGRLAHERGLALHIDGARIFNAAAALGVPAKRLAQAADSICFCLSKALCAPVGSVLCGSHAFIAQARRIRKQVGGGMRQAGILAAAGIVALETMVDRLPEDHANARRLARGLAGIPGILLDAGTPYTNMVIFGLAPSVPIDGRETAERLAELGVRVQVIAPRRFRAALHYWVDGQGVDRVIEGFHQVIASA
ncbi:MAG: threonine aldolase [Chloroflexi bacterium RBG_16_64_43]|nr:MAG: threonine aldolase [Chloroflexi bacterium RBG_16_64_43]